LSGFYVKCCDPIYLKCELGSPDISANFPKKEGFFKIFVVLMLRCRKIEKG